MTHTVLIVEDDFRVAALHARFVEEVEGFSVVGTAFTGADAIEQAQRHHPDLALVDNYLPDRPGTEVARALTCDVIMVTADSAVATVRAALSAGALNYLVKPFAGTQLQHRLGAYARFRQLLPDTGDPLGQAAVDRAFLALRQADQAPAPKGQSPVTARLVVEQLRAGRPAITAASVADALGISRATAQRYLAALTQEGQATVSLRYGAAGRPEHQYTWAG
ncbi:response regulator [Kineosporia mesophila]|uniref:Transcriptional regulatory protein n=1 Tax=Kineosporia mesophila TaxID=566012 RepID=A0ABP6ZNP3_9ACTN|nr:response regulator [Kineosporia mesophila]MCD5354710.1 response regulator [Kineosporia mesophila]